MFQGYDFSQGTERMHHVSASLIRAYSNRAAELQAEGNR